LAATFAAICAEIFLMFLNGGKINPFWKFSSVTCSARASAILHGVEFQLARRKNNIEEKK
jgi:membrane-bound metal-dependent hydrolase YbcI (DUF457 family)